MDCYSIGKSIAEDDEVGQLFQTDILNKSVILKRYENASKAGSQDILVDTVVYFPYDLKNPYDGGESVNFSADGFQEALTFKIAQGYPSKELIDQVVADNKYLNMFASMHSLDPFLFKTKAEQLEIDSEIHEEYFAISKEEWERIRLPIREKISKLVTKALGAANDDGDNLSREQYVERFLTKIWEAKDIDGIESFVDAMQISPEKAPEVFFAWKAVCYYQVRFNEIIDRLKEMFRWVGDNQYCCPASNVGMLPEEQRTLRIKRKALRQRMRDSYLSSHKVINMYEGSYNEFVEEDKPQAFIAFLGDTEESYLSLATHVSVATHCLNLWEQYVETHGRALRNEIFFELFDAMIMLYGNTKTSSDEESE